MAVNFVCYTRLAQSWGCSILVTIVCLSGVFNHAMASQSAELTWNPSADPNVVAYQIYFGTQSGSYQNSVTAGNVTSEIISGLPDGSTNYFAVAAIDNQNYESPLSNQAEYIVPMPAPISLEAQGDSASSQAVDLSWTPSTESDVNSYKVSYGTQSGVYNKSATFSYAANGIISGLAGGTYYFVVSPVDSFGLEPVKSPEVSYTVPMLAPVVLQASTNVAGVALTWTSVTNLGIAGYNIHYGTQSGGYTNVIHYGALFRALITGLNGGQTYYFAVASVDGFGNENPLSNEAFAVAPLPPTIVLQTQLYPGSSGQPDQLLISSPTAVVGNWEMDSSTNLQTWTPYTYGTGYGYGGGADVAATVTLDPTVPQMFFRVVLLQY